MGEAAQQEDQNNWRKIDVKGRKLTANAGGFHTTRVSVRKRLGVIGRFAVI